MKSTKEHEQLTLLISEDESALSRLREEEIILLEQIANGGFLAATKRENILTEVRVVEGRIQKNRKKLASQR